MATEGLAARPAEAYRQLCTIARSANLGPGLAGGGHRASCERREMKDASCEAGEGGGGDWQRQETTSCGATMQAKYSKTLLAGDRTQQPRRAGARLQQLFFRSCFYVVSFLSLSLFSKVDGARGGMYRPRLRRIFASLYPRLLALPMLHKKRWSQEQPAARARERERVRASERALGTSVLTVPGANWSRL